MRSACCVAVVILGWGPLLPAAGQNENGPALTPNLMFADRHSVQRAVYLALAKLARPSCAAIFEEFLITRRPHGAKRVGSAWNWTSGISPEPPLCRRTPGHGLPERPLCSHHDTGQPVNSSLPRLRAAQLATVGLPHHPRGAARARFG